ncbi:MAG: M56 family metallopeptidase [Candidatus Eremiobacteraeota bacterium]|nr:M56 family metallopeptidase [Candidatus Eremiobacteraeota bacterium]
MDALLLAILNALWQGTALIALVALALRLGLRRNATTACVMWSVTFLVVALLPFIDVALAHRTSTPAAPSQPVLAAVADADAWSASRIDPPFAFGAHGGTAPVHVVVIDRRHSVLPSAPSPAAAPSATVFDAVARGVERVRDGATWLGSTATMFARTWGFVVVGTWLLVAASLLLRLVLAYAAIGRMKRDALPLDDPSIEAQLRAAGHRRRATVATSPNVAVPCAIGFRRPMILIPAGLAASLDSDDLARIVLHESAHLQRYDDWGNALEQAVCALQFFQPALHLARRRIDFEREVACDDGVLAAAGEPLRYAECLARMAQRQVRRPRVAFVPGFVLRRAHVVARVRRIVDRSRDASPRLRLAAVALGAGVLVATVGITRLQVPLVTPAAAAPVHAIIVALAKVKTTDKIAKKIVRKDAKKATKVAKRTAAAADRVLIVG